MPSKWGIAVGFPGYTGFPAIAWPAATPSGGSASNLRTAQSFKRERYAGIRVSEGIRGRSRKGIYFPAGHAARWLRVPGRAPAPAPSLQVAAILSILFALAGSRYAIHNWHHPDDPSRLALPLLGIAILLGAWNRFSRPRQVNQEF